MITLSDYLMGRDKTHKEELTDEILANAQTLLKDVNALLKAINQSASVTSGWRPKEINKSAKGAKGSLHQTGRAVDLKDATGLLSYTIIQRHGLLDEFGLWLEFPRFTPGWVHLDKGERYLREVRTFIP